MLSAPTSARLVLTGHGAPAREALWDLISEVRSGDPLAPVTVAVPSTYAGLSLRRDLGRRPGGLVNVRFLSLNRVAELLGAPFLAAPPGTEGRVPLTATHRAGAIRVALDETDGPFRPLATHPATTRAFATTIAELEGLTDPELTRLASTGAREGAVVEVARRVRALVAGTYTDEDQLRAAAAMVAAGGVGLGDLGALVLFAPPSLTPGGLDLVLALAHAGTARAVLACTGDGAADAPIHELASRLAPALGDASTQNAVAVPAGDRILSCADADDEVRVVVRDLLRRLEAGEPLHRMAVTYRNAIPYARLLHEHLAAAGVPVYGPRPATLRETVAGRALLALLHLADGEFRREHVAELLATAPIRDRPGRPPVPGPLWERISCLANVVGGLDQWHARLERYREDRETELARRATEAGTLFAEVADRQVEHTRRLDAFVADLADAVQPPAESWTALAAWAVGLLDRYLAPRGVDGTPWPEDELVAFDRVRERVGALAQLDNLGAPVSTVAFLRAVDDELDVSVGYGGSFGDGVLVAPLSALRGTAFDTVFVLGLVEGAFPPPVRDDPLLSDRARSSVAALTRRSDVVASERADYLAALAAGTARVLTTPRADRRAQRPARPAPWLLETASHLAGRPVLASELDPGHVTTQEASWLQLVASFESALEHAPTAGSLQEHHLRGLLAWKAARRPLVRHPLAVARPDLRTGFTAIRARGRRNLGPWDGVIGARAGLAPGAEQILSPTSLENWAHCPFRYFMAKVLRVEELERPEARERVSPAERGTIIHDVLQEFVAEFPRLAPDQPWSADERAALRAIAERHCDTAEADGITGRAVWWKLDRARILRELDAVLETDEWARAHDGTIPWAFELGFGNAGDALAPLTIDVEGGVPVTFRGRIDRVDRAPDGSRYFVYDYKTGSPTDLLAIEDDPVLKGRKLQLAIYATAVKRSFPDAEVGAHYWFTRERGNDAFAGFILGEVETERLHDALGTIVGSVAAGHFPMYPGADNYLGPENCRWCAFDRVCPRDRARRFERRRDDPALDAITALAEHDWTPEGEVDLEAEVDAP